MNRHRKQNTTALTSQMLNCGCLVLVEPKVLLLPIAFQLPSVLEHCWSIFNSLKMSKTAASQIMAQKLKPTSDCFGMGATLPINGANCEGLALTRFPSLSVCLCFLCLSAFFQTEQSRFHQCFPSLPSWCDTPFGLGVLGAGMYGDLCLPLCSEALE